jgi:cobalt-zinc-cadmium efflux system protein
VIAAGVLALRCDWYWTDLATTVLNSVYALFQGTAMMRDAARILLEGVPTDSRLEDVSRTLATITGVQGVHHRHLWRLDESQLALDAQIVVPDSSADRAQLKRSASKTP